MARIYKHGTPGIVGVADGNGRMAVAPGAGKHILITDIFSFNDATISTVDGGDCDIARMSAGNANLTSPIMVEENKAVYSDANDVSIVYHIIDANTI